jgi:hypothetical protein
MRYWVQDTMSEIGRSTVKRTTGMRATLPTNDQIGPDTPLRLSVAAALAFPDSTMTASRLQRETAERVAGQTE